MIKHRRHELGPPPTPNVTNMIDIMLTLLLFFMLTQGMARPNQMELELPDSTSTAQAQEKPPVIVSYRVVDGKPELTVNAQVVSSIEQVGDAIRAVAKPEDGSRVEMRIDKHASYQDVRSLMDAVQNAGFPKLSLPSLLASKTAPVQNPN